MTTFPPGIPPAILSPPVIPEPEPPMRLVLLFDKDRIVEGVVCIESALSADTDLKVFVLALDDEAYGKMQGISESVTVISLPEIEAHFPAIAATKSSRPWPAYVNSLKPFLPDFIFGQHRDVRTAVCVDSDMHFYRPISELIRVIGRHSFAVVAAEAAPLAPVLFNDGFFMVRNSSDGLAFLRWWQSKVTEWCLCEHGSGLDQSAAEGYLNIILRNPAAHPGTRGVRFPGANLASWNVNAHTVAASDDGIIVDSTYPLICYHFFNFQDDRQPYNPAKAPTSTVEELIFRPYHAKLVAARARLGL